MITEYYPCECCGLMTKDTDFWLSPLTKQHDICGECRSVQLEIIAEQNKKECDCRAGCDYCLMTGK